MTADPRDVVTSGYDAIAATYLSWSGRIADDPRLRFLETLLSRLPERADVLELGCGAGVPCTAMLAERHDVLGIDLSETQLALARKNVPGARFRRGDMTRLELPENAFDAVAAFYSVLHVPREEHGALFADIARWLRPGGLFLAALGSGRTHGFVPDWLGAPMYFSSHPPETNRALLRKAGFAPAVDEVVTMHEPEGPATFHWVLASAE